MVPNRSGSPPIESSQFAPFPSLSLHAQILALNWPRTSKNGAGEGRDGHGWRFALWKTAGVREADGPSNPSRFRTWAERRAAPLVATGLTLFFGMDYVILWAGLTRGEYNIWLAPSDVWGTYLDSVALVHGHLSSGYAAYPGILVALAPIAAIGSALHLEVGPNFAAFATPTGWVLLGPFILLIASLPLFAADAVAERWGVPRSRRFALSIAEAVLLANVTVKWGHPEDAVAVGLALFAAVALAAERVPRAGWLLGAAIAVQPLALLAVPALLTVVGVRWGARALGATSLRAVAPAAALLLPALALDWSQLSDWLTHQPNYIGFNHSTPWTTFAPRLVFEGFSGVAAGPSRVVGIAVAVVASFVLCRRTTTLQRVVLALAVAFAARVASEAVLDAYYTWPVLALGVLCAAPRRASVFFSAVGVAVFATWFSNSQWGGADLWWAVLMVLLLALFGLATWRHDDRKLTASLVG